MLIAKGADELAKKYALDNNISYVEFAANWAKYGPAAGPHRNKEIIDACDVVVAFWDGKSKGTANSIKLAKCKCSPLHIIRY